jgi:hypothetical protein
LAGLTVKVLALVSPQARLKLVGENEKLGKRVFVIVKLQDLVSLLETSKKLTYKTLPETLKSEEYSVMFPVVKKVDGSPLVQLPVWTIIFCFSEGKSEEDFFVKTLILPSPTDRVLDFDNFTPKFIDVLVLVPKSIFPQSATVVNGVTLFWYCKL